MYQTKHDLPAQTRADVIVILNARLAAGIDLMHQTVWGRTSHESVTV